MILQALAAYYQRLAKDDDTKIAPEGFEQKEIPFIFVINEDGKFCGIQDTREGEARKQRARVFTVPKGVKKTSGIAANLLWDTPNYVLGKPKNDTSKSLDVLLARASEQHQAFITKINETFPEPVPDAGVRAVLAFLEENNFDQVVRDALWPEIETSGAVLTFKLKGDDCLICQRPAVTSVIKSMVGGASGGKQMCLVTGEQDTPKRTHTAIKGVKGAQTSGANIVSFNLDAFKSYGKEQGFNAPVGEKAEFAYTTALNRLLTRDSRQKIQIGDTTIVFWAEKRDPLEDIFPDFFREPAKGEPEQDHRQLLAMYKSPESGARVELNPLTKFYVLGLSPSAARIAVRFWHAEPAGDIATNIWQHFDDLEIVKGGKEWRSIGLSRLLRSTAFKEKYDNISPRIVGDTIQAILANIPYPKTLLIAVLNRIKAEQASKDAKGKPAPNVTYTRAALIKAILVREARYRKQIKKEVGMSLDITNANPGYLLGRLFALLEKAQESASPGINSTIRDRFYGAASSTPITVFPSLMKLKNHHLAKLENRGQAVNLEKQIGEIVNKLVADEAFPSHLNLKDQGRFAVGYYHQRQDFFTKKKNETEKEEAKNE